MIIVLAFPAHPGWVNMRFRFSREVNGVLKSIPGCRWDMQTKKWFAPYHALSSINAELVRLGIGRLSWEASKANIIQKPAFWDIARDYQQAAIHRVLAYDGNFLCVFDMRTGKTLVGLSVLQSVLDWQWANSGLLLFPSMATDEWKRQWAKFAMTTPLYIPEAVVSDEELAELVKIPKLTIGVSYETIHPISDGNGKKWGSICKLLEARGTWYLVADELHYLQNRKAGRSNAAKAAAHHARCVGRLGLTGTPLRNRTANAFGPLDFVYPGQWGSWSKFTGRYSAGQMGEHGWEAKGKSNEQEMEMRLNESTLRVTRQQAAPWLPKSERIIHRVELTVQQRNSYAKFESAVAHSVRNTLNDSGGSLQVLEKLAASVSHMKISKVNERLSSYILAGKKVICAALFHESLNNLWNAKGNDAPGFLAAGWFQRERREREIAAWRAQPGAAVLYCNILSSGMAIDLSDAEATVSLEVPWVPADFLQFEARIHDIHQGKRSSPPVHEYVLAKGTVDEAMGMKLIDKLAVIEQVLGADAESQAARLKLTESGLVNTELVGLGKVPDNEIVSVLNGLRDKWLTGLNEVESIGEDNDENRQAQDDEDEEESEKEAGQE